MRVVRRKAVSPIIASLLLIAIAVAAGVIVYVFTSSLAGSLTKNGGHQVTEQISLDAYNFQALNKIILYVRNTGGSSVNMSAIYVDGSLCAASGPVCSAMPSFASACTNGMLTVQDSCQVTLTVVSQAAGTSHSVRIVTSDGGTFPFNVVAGQTG